MKSLYQAADAPFLTRDQAKALTDRVLGMAKADETRVSLNTGWSGNTRFAGAEITTSGGITDTSLTVTATVGRRRASATTNVLDDASLRRTVDLAERLARLSPEDPELMPELGPQQYLTVNGYLNTTAALAPEARAEAVKRVVDTARETGKAAGDMFVAGYLEANAGANCLATSRGLFAYHASTDVNLGVTARTPDATGSGWASGGARDWSLLDAAALGRRAAEKAAASRNPVAMEPGMHTAVLEAAAAATLVPSVAGAANARNAEEGRSPFSKAGG
jgi:predicted Zn-dependent protease